MPPLGSLPCLFSLGNRKKPLEQASFKVSNHPETLTMLLSVPPPGWVVLWGLGWWGIWMVTGTMTGQYSQLDEEMAGLRVPKLYYSFYFNFL